MLRPATAEETLTLAKLLLETSSGFRRVTAQDRFSAAQIELMVSDDDDDQVYRSVEHIPVIEGMGS